MKMTSPVYPGGLLGAGLALLRLSLVAAILTSNLLPELGGTGQWLSAILCASLGLGAGARWSAVASALAMVALGPAMDHSRDFAIVGGMASLALTGPGAYSIDARVWGRVRVRPRSSR